MSANATSDGTTPRAKGEKPLAAFVLRVGRRACSVAAIILWPPVPVVQKIGRSPTMIALLGFAPLVIPFANARLIPDR